VPLYPACDGNSEKKKPAVDREAVKSTAGQCPEGMEPGRVKSGSAPESLN
jgi:hypothetical protein